MVQSPTVAVPATSTAMRGGPVAVTEVMVTLQGIENPRPQVNQHQDFGIQTAPGGAIAERFSTLYPFRLPPTTSDRRISVKQERGICKPAQFITTRGVPRPRHSFDSLPVLSEPPG